jgi:hypothetical protein
MNQRYSRISIVRARLVCHLVLLDSRHFLKEFTLQLVLFANGKKPLGEKEKYKR